MKPKFYYYHARARAGRMVTLKSLEKIRKCLSESKKQEVKEKKYRLI